MADMPQEIIFTVHSLLGKHIRLTETQWRHIRKRQEMHGQLERMQETLAEPDVVYYVPGEETYHYYRFYPQTPVSSKHMLVITKHLDGEGFVITCFYARRISKPEKVLLYESRSQKPL
jgi:hypothetical protein